MSGRNADLLPSSGRNPGGSLSTTDLQIPPPRSWGRRRADTPHTDRRTLARCYDHNAAGRRDGHPDYRWVRYDFDEHERDYYSDRYDYDFY